MPASAVTLAPLASLAASDLSARRGGVVVRDAVFESRRAPSRVVSSRGRAPRPPGAAFVDRSSGARQNPRAPFPSGVPDANGIVPGVGKGMPKWPEVWLWLNEEKRMRTLDSAEAAKMCFGGGKRNAVLLDVRFEPDYEKWSIPGSVHVPYVTGGVLAKMRLPGFKKKNVDFVSQVERLVPDKNTEIVLACIWGGSLVREPPKNRGLTDDTKGAGSLPGAFELYQAGYRNLYHLHGGVNQYYQDCAFDASLPEGEGTWPGDLEWFGYRQFVGKDRLKGQRDD